MSASAQRVMPIPQPNVRFMAKNARFTSNQITSSESSDEEDHPIRRGGSEVPEETENQRNTQLLEEKMITIEQLNDKIQMYFRRQEKPTEGQMTMEEDLDEFDSILVAISMLQMHDDEENFTNFDQIKAIYQRRAQRKEFPVSSYIAYLQFAVTNKDTTMAEDLITYAYKNIFHKLPWLERIHALDIAFKIRHKSQGDMIEIFVIQFLRSDLKSFLIPSIQTKGKIAQVSVHNIVEMLSVFQMDQLKNLEAWKKGLYILSMIYSQTLEEHQRLFKDEPMLTKNDLILLTAIFTEQNISEPLSWQCIQQDLLASIKYEEKQF